MHRSRMSLAALAIGAAVTLAVTACSKSDNSSTSSAESTAGAMQAASVAASPATGGAQVYSTNCSSCHQTNGQGVPGAFPPLAGNATVTGDPKTVIHIVKYGLSGKVQVGHETYNGMMPPWGTQLSAAAVASVISYIRTSWGNAASPVTLADVKAVSR
jgi:mono/diheme cytochrome c family protein